MDRIPEPELMNDERQVSAYAAADFSATDAAFVAAILARFDFDLDLGGAAVADLGCGPGNIALRVAAMAPSARIVAYDGAPAMLRAATDRATSLGLINVVFQAAILPDDALPASAYDLIISNSMLHHLHDPAVLWDTVARLGKPHAAVFIGDLRRPDDAAAVQHLLDTYAADAPAVLRADFKASLHAAFTPDEVRSQLDAASLTRSSASAGLKVEARGDRHLYVHGRLP